jgi:hypothetical protein
MPAINHILLKLIKPNFGYGRNCDAIKCIFLWKVSFALCTPEFSNIGIVDNSVFNSIYYWFKNIRVISYPLQNPIKNVIKSPT